MSRVIQRQHPDIDGAMWTAIDQVIAENRGKSGSIITVLRESQAIAGYLPVELIDYISAHMNLPVSEVFGVASFYSLFSMKPKGRHTVRMCLGTACYVKGVKEALARISNTFEVAEGETSENRRFSLEGVRCLGACGLAPVMVVGGDTYGDISADKVIDILEKYE